MKKTLLFLCLVLASLNTAIAQNVEVPFTNLSAEGGTFFKINNIGEFQGSLTSVTINATLNSSLLETYASDLTVYVTADDGINSTGLLQIGGYTDLFATQSYPWENGNSEVAGTVVSGTITLTTPIDFTGSTYTVWIGNGFIEEGAAGVWSGTVTLNGITEATASTTDFLASKLSVFPNPVNDVVTVANNANLSVSAININDSNGRTIKTVKLNDVSEVQVNVSDLNAGIYFMNITTNEGVTTKKIIKK